MSGLETQSAAGGDGSFEAMIDAETMQTTVALVDALVDECHLYVDDDGIRIPAMDPATVAAVELTLDSTAFESYDATDVHLGVDVARFGDIVGMADRDQLVSFSLDSETRKLVIRIGELRYTLSLIDPSTVRSPPDGPDAGFGFTAEVVTEAATVSRAVKAAEMVSNHVTLGLDDERGAFYAEADGDTDDISLAVPFDDLVDCTPGEAQSLFSVTYLQSIERALPNDAEITLELGVEVPLAMRFSFADGDGAVEYLVSPRIARR